MTSGGWQAGGGGAGLQNVADGAPGRLLEVVFSEFERLDCDADHGFHIVGVTLARLLGYFKSLFKVLSRSGQVAQVRFDRIADDLAGILVRAHQRGRDQVISRKRLVELTRGLEPFFEHVQGGIQVPV